MGVESIDFDDLPEENFEEREKTINITIKVPESTRNMFSKIAHRERRNMLTLGGIVIEEYINNYVEKYKSDRETDK